MTVDSGVVTKRLLERLLKDQERRARRERNLPYARKLEILDGIWDDISRSPSRSHLRRRIVEFSWD